MDESLFHCGFTSAHRELGRAGSSPALGALNSAMRGPRPWALVQQRAVASASRPPSPHRQSRNSCQASAWDAANNHELCPPFVGTPGARSVAEADRIHTRLSAERTSQNPKFIELAKRLTERYPCMTTLEDDDLEVAWSDGPLDGETDSPVYSLGVQATMLGVVVPFVETTANARSASRCTTRKPRRCTSPAARC